MNTQSYLRVKDFLMISIRRISIVNKRGHIPNCVMHSLLLERSQKLRSFLFFTIAVLLVIMILLRSCTFNFFCISVSLS